jgi:3'-5' exoribonuclease 1
MSKFNSDNSSEYGHTSKVEELRKILVEMELDTRGNIATLKKRIRNQKKREKKQIVQFSAAQARWNALLETESDDWSLEEETRRKEWTKRLIDRKKLPKTQPFEFLLCLDIEATCDASRDYNHEVIEFPVVLVDTRTQKVVDQFHSFCKPSLNPILTDFCVNLTGISQETVDKSQTFPYTLAKFERWLSAVSSPPNYEDCVFVTDTSFDIGKFLKMQLIHDALPLPMYIHSWINVRMIVKTLFGIPKSTNVNLEEMVDKLGMTFQGRPHSGLDDARNVAFIAIELMKRQIILKENAKLKGLQKLLLPPAVHSSHPSNEAVQSENVN